MVKIQYRDEEWELRHGMTVRDAILKVGLHPLTVLPLRDGKLIHGETLLNGVKQPKGLGGRQIFVRQ